MNFVCCRNIFIIHSQDSLCISHSSKTDGFVNEDRAGKAYRKQGRVAELQLLGLSWDGCVGIEVGEIRVNSHSKILQKQKDQLANK